VIRAFILAQSASDRDRLRSLLASADIAVLGASTSLDELRGSRADVVVLADQGLAGSRLSTLPPAVLWTDDEDAARRLRDSASGAWAVVGRQASPAQLQAAARAVASGLCAVPVHAAAALLDSDVPSMEPEADEEEGFAAAEPLTPRERDVLDLASRGLSNREIGGALGISEHTVKFHLGGIFGKLGVSTRTAAVRRGLRRRIIAI
jgi:two-component system nitrate/nitrite response regulator NarL